MAGNINGFNVFPKEMHILLIFLHPLTRQGTGNWSVLKELNQECTSYSIILPLKVTLMQNSYSFVCHSLCLSICINV